VGTRPPQVSHSGVMDAFRRCRVCLNSAAPRADILVVRPRLVIAGALIVSGLLVLVVGGYLGLASGVVCENNPDCIPDWWWPVVTLLATLLAGSGVAVALRVRR
jgi:hypothetical protein